MSARKGILKYNLKSPPTFQDMAYPPGRILSRNNMQKISRSFQPTSRNPLIDISKGLERTDYAIPEHKYELSQTSRADELTENSLITAKPIQRSNYLAHLEETRFRSPKLSEKRIPTTLINLTKSLPKKPAPLISPEKLLFPKLIMNTREVEESKEEANFDNSPYERCKSENCKFSMGSLVSDLAPKLKSQYLWKGGPKINDAFIPNNDSLLYSIRALRLCYRSKLHLGKPKLLPFCKVHENGDKFKVLILDLEQTLTCELSKNTKLDTNGRPPPPSKHKFRLIPPATVKVDLIPKETDRAPILVRPHLKKFLYNMKSFFEIVVFSDEDEEYIKSVLRRIDANNHFITGYLSKENMSEMEVENSTGIVRIKSLDNIVGAEKKDCVILDDTMHLWPFDMDNLIVAEPYTGNTMDTFLPRIAQFLVKLATSNDLGSEIKAKSKGLMLKQDIKE